MCEGFGNGAGLQGGEIILNNVRREEEEGKLSEGPKKKKKRGCRRGAGYGGKPPHSEGRRGRGGPLCGSLTDNGLIRPDVA